ncbi:MAG: pyridoxal phosphate-dependent aminotransferase [Planctomycetota bacterium]
MPRSRSHRLADLAQSDIRAMTRACNAVGGINLGQGICDLPTPALVADGAVRAIRERQSTYSYSEGILPLRQAIATKLARDNGIQADPESEILVTSGSAGAFACAIHGLLDPGDGILIPEPYYGYHVNAAIVAGLEVQTVVAEAPKFRLTADLLRSGLRDNTRAVVVCTPSNPSGRMLTREELGDLAEVARERDLLVITDEIYEYIRYDGREHISPATVEDLAQRTVTIMGLSKTFSITGWRLGYAVAPAEMAQAMTLVHDLFYICAPTPLQHGVTAGFAAPPEFFRELRADYAQKRELLCSTLEQCGLPCVRPEGAYYVLADVTGLGCRSAHEAAMQILERCRVACIPGTAFYTGAEGERLVRLCFAKQHDELSEACDRLRSLKG